MSTTRTADPNSPVARYIASLDGLSDDPLRRAAQIALATLDTLITAGDYGDEHEPAITAAYDALCAALS